MVCVRWLPAMALLALLGACASSPLGLGQPRELELVVQDLEGNDVNVADLEGVRVVEFWASWCRPCIEQRPQLEAFAAEHADLGVRVIAVSVDFELDDLLGHLATRPTSLDVLWDRAGVASDAYTQVPRGNAVPTALVVDRDDRIVGRHRGASDEQFAALRQEVAEALAPAPAKATP